MYIIIVGGGKVGFYLAEELLRSNHEVLVIEWDRKRATQLGEELGQAVIHGDGCEARTLEEAGIARARVVVAVTGDDEDNLVVCELAKYHGVGRAIARINDPRNEELFKRRAIETTVSATQAILSQIEQELPTAASETMIELFQLHAGLALVEVRVPELSPVAGHPLRDLLLPEETLVVLILRADGEAIIPGGDTIIDAGDGVVVVTRRDSEPLLREAIVGTSHGMDT